MKVKSEIHEKFKIHDFAPIGMKFGLDKFFSFDGLLDGFLNQFHAFYHVWEVFFPQPNKISII